MDWVSGQGGWKKGLNHSTQKLVFNGPKWNWDVVMSGVPQGWVGRLNWMTSRGPKLFCDSVIKPCRASSSIGSFRFLWINGLGCSPGTFLLSLYSWVCVMWSSSASRHVTISYTTSHHEICWDVLTSSDLLPNPEHKHCLKTIHSMLPDLGTWKHKVKMNWLCRRTFNKDHFLLQAHSIFTEVLPVSVPISQLLWCMAFLYRTHAVCIFTPQ